MKLSACFEGNVKENPTCYTHAAAIAATATTIITTTQVKGIVVKLYRKI